MKQQLIKFYIAIFAGIFVFTSCNKLETRSEEFIPITTFQDYINTFNAFALSTEEEITSGENDLKSAAVWDCLTVTHHPNENGEFWPRSWTLDYGTENCECFAGISRRGKIHINLSSRWRNEGSLREITFEDFYFNDNQLEGIKTFSNTGLNENGNITFTKNVDNAKLTYADGTFISWESEKYSELIEGSDSFLFADDVWSVTGGGTGINLDGKEYSFTIMSPLIYKNGCFYPVSGIIEIEVADQSVQTIDYGNGDCDNLATITVDGITEDIDL